MMLAVARPFFRARPSAVHAFALTVLLAGSLTMLLGGEDDAVKAMGRNPDLTGRTDIWRTVIPMVPNSMLGAGFETFWCGPRKKIFHDTFGGMSMANEAHNGYIEVYLNLGWLGVGLIALILWHSYRTAVSAFRRDSSLGPLLVAYVPALVAYNIGEAGFRMLSLPWFFLLLSTLAAAALSALAKPRLADRSLGNSYLLESEPPWIESCRPLPLRDTAGAYNRSTGNEPS